MSHSFYFPYARKLWGLDPDQLAVTTAERRIAGNSIPKILLKVARQIPGFKRPRTGGFYYPRKGYGQICEALKTAAERYHAEFVMGARVSRIEHEGGRVRTVAYEKEGKATTMPVDAAWSTLPISLLVRLMSPAAPPDVLAAASAMRFRGMILIYLVLEQDQFSEYDAHYFPEASIPMSRMSEPTNYSTTKEPRGLTVSWFQYGGPAKATFEPAGAIPVTNGTATTKARFAAPGTYTLLATANDGQLSQRTVVVVTVTASTR